jgi:methyltransferase
MTLSGTGLDPLSVIVLALVTLQRLGELILAQRNTASLISEGGVEHGAAHYPLIVGLHAAWLGGLWLLASGTTPSWPWLAVFLALQALRLWILATLGRRWTTRIVVLPGAPLVSGGPYRYLSHPNYAVVSAEILVLPAAFGLWTYALAFSLLNTLLLSHRIRVEEDALRKVGAASPGGAR